MRDKKTHIESEELPDLTEQQMGFVIDIMSGKTAAEAYRNNYNCQNMKDSSVWVESSRLKKNPKITPWLNAIKIEQAKAASYSHDDHISELEHLAQVALKSGNIGAAVQATIHKGKSTGHYTDKIEVTSPDNDLEALELVRQLAGEKAYQEACKKLGINPTVH